MPTPSIDLNSAPDTCAEWIARFLKAGGRLWNGVRFCDSAKIEDKLCGFRVKFLAQPRAQKSRSA